MVLCRSAAQHKGQQVQAAEVRIAQQQAKRTCQSPGNVKGNADAPAQHTPSQVRSAQVMNARTLLHQWWKGEQQAAPPAPVELLQEALCAQGIVQVALQHNLNQQRQLDAAQMRGLLQTPTCMSSVTMKHSAAPCRARSAQCRAQNTACSAADAASTEQTYRLQVGALHGTQTQDTIQRQQQQQ